MNTIIFDTPEEYHSKKAVSNSGISKILRCPAMFRAWQDGELYEKGSDALLFGSVFHCLALEPEEFYKRYIVMREDGRTKAGREEKETAAAKGLEQVRLDIWHNAHGMASAIRNKPILKKIISSQDIKREVSIYWQEEIYGIAIPCKARIDLLATVPGFGLVAVDLKSTEDAHPDSISKNILKWGYYRQGAWYRRALESIGTPSDVFLLVLVEKNAPYIVTPINIAQQAINKGNEECNKALEIYAGCIKMDKWPCYTEEILEIDLPEYFYKSI